MYSMPFVLARLLASSVKRWMPSRKGKKSRVGDVLDLVGMAGLGSESQGHEEPLRIAVPIVTEGDGVSLPSPKGL